MIRRNRSHYDSTQPREPMQWTEVAALFILMLLAVGACYYYNTIHTIHKRHEPLCPPGHEEMYGPTGNFMGCK